MRDFFKGIEKADFIYKKSKREPCFYYEIPATFDIECTTIQNVETPYGFMYMWQFCTHGKVEIGRTWDELLTFLDEIIEFFDLNYERKLVIYCHFLSYEFQFLRGFLQFETIFAKEARKIIKASTRCFEFRCSYFLSNMSLEKFCQNSSLCVHHKLSGDDFDYSKIRTPETPLSDLELEYGTNDVLGLYECILSKLADGDTLVTIPLTSTGYVRRDCKKAMSKNRKNRFQFLRNRLTIEQYKFVKKIFRGGDTHANRYYVDAHLYDLDSYDLQSSYPAWIMTDYYPMGKLTQLKDSDLLDDCCKRYCVFMKIGLLNVNIKFGEPHTYIDIAHVDKRKNIVNDNGRVKSADYIEYYCTEIDYEIIKECYDYDKENVVLLQAYYCPRGFLPKELKEALLQYYDGKTTLKGIESKVYEYFKSKNKLNAIFGMMVSALIHEEHLLIEDEWKLGEIDEQEQLDKFYEQYSGFLSYQWGIYVTAHARQRLRQGIKACVINGISYAVYWDTDSIKFFSNPVIENRIKEINEERVKECECAEIRAYSDYKGKRYYMGIWEKEEHIDEFKTYGAKKYCTIINGKFKITVAGMNKEKGTERMLEYAGDSNPIDTQFILGKTFAKVGRTVSYYNDDSSIKTINVNGVEIKTAANIGVVDTTYTLGITGDYQQIIDQALEEQK